MAGPTNEEIVHGYAAAYAAMDLTALGTFRHPEWTMEWPQTGERVRGHANDVAMHEVYPGGLPEMHLGHVIGSEDRWVLSPMLTFQRIVGSGDHWWCDGTATYPDGSRWVFATLLELRDARIYREKAVFGPITDPPAWRRDWVEPIEQD